MRAVARLLAAFFCVALDIVFVGDVVWGGLPHSQAAGVAGVLLTTALLAWLLCAAQRRPKSGM